MASIRVGLATGLAALVVIGLAALLSVLYISLGAVVQKSHETLFVEKVRIFAHQIAAQLEVERVAESPKLEASLLDSVILNGDGVYAELTGPGVELRSALGPAQIRFPAVEDTVFAQNDDGIFFIKRPVTSPGGTLQLRLGFDERLTVATISNAKRQMLWILSIGLGLSALAASMSGYVLARTLRRLQAAARRITSGDYGSELRVPSPVRELHELSLGLDHMRIELVGANEQLRTQIREKELIEERRVGLERQLQHQQRVEIVGTLAGGIAHEFNNVLVPIILLSELVLKRLPDGHESRADVTTILSAARRARDLVKQILAFSRDISDLAMEPVDLRAVADEALRLLRPLISPNCRLDGRYEPSVSVVQADRGLVLQLVMNLCKNAYQSIAAGTGAITVNIADVNLRDEERAGLAPGHYVLLAVRDTGTGMDPATAARIFEPFFTTRPVGEGTGLGLSVVQGITESLGARIFVESAIGSGSTFSIFFPALPALT